MEEEQVQKPSEKKTEASENLPEFVPKSVPEPPKPSEKAEPAQPVIPPAASTSRLTADEIAILNAIDMEKEEMKKPEPTSPAQPVPVQMTAPLTAAAASVPNPSPEIAKPIQIEQKPEKGPIFSFPFIKKNDSTKPVQETAPKPITEKKPLFSLFAKKNGEMPISEKPAEKKPIFSVFAKKTEEKPKAIENENKQTTRAMQIVTDNWKKLVPVLILVGAFAIFLMLRNSFSYMTGYAISGVPLLTTDYLSIIIMGLLAFLAIFGTEKLMNKMYKYM